ncbi:MAG: phosphoribosylformylglycinamidine synthase subunit PurS [Bacteroidota bacterium]
MNYIAKINVMPKKEILDPQGKAVRLGLENLGLENVEDVRVGRHITVQLSADDEPQAQKMVEEACTKLLANLIMESYDYKLEEVQV